MTYSRHSPRATIFITLVRSNGRVASGGASACGGSGADAPPLAARPRVSVFEYVMEQARAETG